MENFKDKIMSRIPDNVVFSNDKGYYAQILPYASNVGAPAIKVNDVASWKVNGINRVNKDLSSKFQDLKEEYNKLIKEYEWNELVYNAKFSFEPVVGEVYHVYRNKQGKEFLSLISPNEWNQEYVGTTMLNSDRKWVLFDTNV